MITSFHNDLVYLERHGQYCRGMQRISDTEHEHNAPTFLADHTASATVHTTATHYMVIGVITSAGCPSVRLSVNAVYCGSLRVYVQTTGNSCVTVFLL